jgi:integrase/recombinase XerD
MAKAKIISSAELRRVLDYISTRPHAVRNRAMILMTHWAGMRVGEVASLRYCDVLNKDGTVKDEIHLSAEQTKGRHSRTVYVNTKLRKELALYVAAKQPREPIQALFYTQKNPKRGFTASTLTQYFGTLYDRVGLEGASSHSGRRSCLTSLANKGTAIHILKVLAGHRNISTTAEYLYASATQLKAAAELI